MRYIGKLFTSTVLILSVGSACALPEPAAEPIPGLEDFEPGTLPLSWKWATGPHAYRDSEGQFTSYTREFTTVSVACPHRGVMRISACRIGGPAVVLVATMLAVSFGAAPAGASTVIAIVYDNKNYGGAKTNYTAPTGHVCTSSTSTTERQKAQLVRNDKASSFSSYSGCRTKLYEHANFSGATYGWYGNVAEIKGIFNDEASSAKWT